MRVVDILRAKRDGEPLSSEAIKAFVMGASEGNWPDYQLSALLMAIKIRGMNGDETATLTRAMADSGDRFEWADVPGPKVDKHSTGGVGDKTSLILAPIVAAAGAIVPMMSGRGLGHTGGTLDKLESIAGFTVRLEREKIRATLLATGLCLFGQTARVAPADRKLYALRDVTATVESIPLITASILSKKLAEGIDGLVMDVKFGAGAFMKNVDDARALANSIVKVGTLNGLRTEAMLTGMESPLGRAVGNSLEVIECLEILKGKPIAPEARELSLALSAAMIQLAGLAKSPAEAGAIAEKALTSGAALERFRRTIECQGGDPRVVDDYALLPTAPKRELFLSPETGVLVGLQAEAIGRAAMALGAGRDRSEDPVDHAVGVTILADIGQSIRVGEPVFEIHYRGGDRLEAALSLLRSSLSFSTGPVAKAPRILERITSPS